jgi:hypothetical protein
MLALLDVTYYVGYSRHHWTN